MTHLRLTRAWYTNNATVGILTINDVFECFTLEDRTRDVKIMGRSAIPPGDYAVTITHSPKFNRDLPLIKDVPLAIFSTLIKIYRDI